MKLTQLRPSTVQDLASYDRRHAWSGSTVEIHQQRRKSDGGDGRQWRTPTRRREWLVTVTATASGTLVCSLRLAELLRRRGFHRSATLCREATRSAATEYKQFVESSGLTADDQSTSGHGNPASASIICR